MHPDLLGFLLAVAGLVLAIFGGLALWAWRVIRRLVERARRAEADLARLHWDQTYGQRKDGEG